MIEDHSICILDNGAEDDFIAISRKIDESISNGYAVIYAAEDDATDVLGKLKQNRIVEDIEDHIQNGTLNLMNIEAEASSIRELLQKWKSVIYRIKRDRKHRGVLIISDVSLAFAKTKNFEKFSLFEQSIRQDIRKRRWLEIIYCYHKRTIDEMPIRHLIPVAKSHSHLLNKDWINTRIDDYSILSTIEKGIDDILGANSGKLFFRSLRLVYKIDEDRIIQQPELLEEKLQKMFGRSGHQILQSVGRRLRNEIYKL